MEVQLRRTYLPKLFGKSGWVPNRSSESGQEGSKESRSAISLAARSTAETPLAIFQTVSPRTRVNRARRRAEAAMPRPTNCLTSGLLPRLRDGADLPHHAKGVVVRPIFCDLAAGETLEQTLEREGPHRHPVAPGGDAHQFALVGPISYPPGAHLLAFGYLLLNGEVKIGEDITVHGDELLQALRA